MPLANEVTLSPWLRRGKAELPSAYREVTTGAMVAALEFVTL